MLKLKVELSEKEEGTVTIDAEGLVTLVREQGIKIPDGASIRVTFDIPSGYEGGDTITLSRATPITVSWTKTTPKALRD